MRSGRPPAYRSGLLDGTGKGPLVNGQALAYVRRLSINDEGGGECSC